MAKPPAGAAPLRRAIDRRHRAWVLIPIETKAREYHAKLLLACTAAEAGFGVILGSMDRLTFNLPFLPRGILFLNNIATINEKKAPRCRKLGFRLAAWCEEGIAYRNRAAYRHERVSPPVVRTLERFFAWGPYHAEDVRAACDPADQAKVIESGSPRLDLLRPGMRELFRGEAQRIRARFGRILLVNTNFHRYNHYLGRGAYLDQLRERGKVPDAERERFFQAWIDYLGDMYRAFADLLGRLSAAFPDHTIVLRPHPSEDHAAWRAEAADLPNVRVIHEGSALPWILASEVLIHNSCATGIEAAVMDVPVIAYRPIRSEAYDSYLPNAVSLEARSADELIDLARSRCANPGAASAGTREALRLFSGLGQVSACERIVAELAQLQIRARPFAATPVHALAMRAAIRTWPPLRGLLRRLVKGPNPLVGYLDQKFPGLTADEVTADLDRLRLICGRFADVRAVQIGEWLFALTAPQRTAGTGKAPS